MRACDAQARAQRRMARSRWHDTDTAHEARRRPSNAPADRTPARRRSPPAAPATRVEVAPGVHWLRMPLPFALDHINLWLHRRKATAARSSTAATATRRRARCGNGTSPTTLARPADRAHHRHALPPRPRRQRARGSPRASAAPVDDDARRVPHGARADWRTAPRYGRRDTRALFAAHGMRAEHVAALRGARQPLPARRAGAAARVRAPASTATRSRSAAALARHRRLRPLARARGAATRRARGVLISGDMLLPRITTNVSVWPVEPDGDPLRASSIRSARFEALPPTRWCCRRTACRSAASRCASRSCARITRRGSPSSQAALASRRAAERRRRRAGAVPARARPAAALLRDGRGDRASQSPVARADRVERMRRRRRSDPLRRVRCALIRPHSQAPRRALPCPHRHNPRRARRRPALRSRRARRIARPAAEKSAKADRRLRRAPGRVGHSARHRRARARQGVHGARREDAGQSRTRLAEAQMNLWWDYMNLWQASTLQAAGRRRRTRSPSRRRATSASSHEDWQEHFLFDYIKQSYLIAARWLHDAVGERRGPRPSTTKKKVDFFTRQYIDALAPSNFALTNPEVFRETIATGGQNLVKGLQQPARRHRARQRPAARSR